MITITHNNISKFIGNSAAAFSGRVTLVDINNETVFIWDLNDQNAAILYIEDYPNDWVGGKYLYTEGQWSLNPNYES